jgi:hypothetical protein
MWVTSPFHTLLPAILRVLKIIPTSSKGCEETFHYPLSQAPVLRVLKIIPALWHKTDGLSTPPPPPTIPIHAGIKNNTHITLLQPCTLSHTHQALPAPLQHQATASTPLNPHSSHLASIKNNTHIAVGCHFTPSAYTQLLPPVMRVLKIIPALLMMHMKVRIYNNTNSPPFCEY